MAIGLALQRPPADSERPRLDSACSRIVPRQGSEQSNPTGLPSVVLVQAWPPARSPPHDWQGSQVEVGWGHGVGSVDGRANPSLATQ